MDVHRGTLKGPPMHDVQSFGGSSYGVFSSAGVSARSMALASPNAVNTAVVAPLTSHVPLPPASVALDTPGL